MRHYERRLPHGDTVDQPLFVTFRLHGSLPAHRVFPPDGLAGSGKAFVAMDRLLDRGATGPLYLHRPELADMVVAALHDGERKFHRYQLHAYVVMPSHVHLLVTPTVVAARWLAPLKGFTAYRANEWLGSYGQAFDENPVRAGRVAEAQLYPWSSAASRVKGGCGHDWPPCTLWSADLAQFDLIQRTWHAGSAMLRFIRTSQPLSSRNDVSVIGDLGTRRRFGSPRPLVEVGPELTRVIVSIARRQFG